MRSNRFSRQARLSESYMIDHYHDSRPESIEPYDYSYDLLRKCTSRKMWFNPKFSEFLQKLNEIIVYQVDSIAYIRNQRNYTVDKYYNDYLD